MVYATYNYAYWGYLHQLITLSFFWWPHELWDWTPHPTHDRALSGGCLHLVGEDSVVLLRAENEASTAWGQSHIQPQRISKNMCII